MGVLSAASHLPTGILRARASPADGSTRHNKTRAQSGVKPAALRINSTHLFEKAIADGNVWRVGTQRIDHCCRDRCVVACKMYSGTHNRRGHKTLLRVRRLNSWQANCEPGEVAALPVTEHKKQIPRAHRSSANEFRDFGNLQHTFGQQVTPTTCTDWLVQLHATGGQTTNVIRFAQPVANLQLLCVHAAAA